MELSSDLRLDLTFVGATLVSMSFLSFSGELSRKFGSSTINLDNRLLLYSCEFMMVVLGCWVLLLNLTASDNCLMKANLKILTATIIIVVHCFCLCFFMKCLNMWLEAWYLTYWLLTIIVPGSFGWSHFQLPKVYCKLGDVLDSRIRVSLSSSSPSMFTSGLRGLICTRGVSLSDTISSSWANSTLSLHGMQNVTYMGSSML